MARLASQVRFTGLAATLQSSQGRPGLDAIHALPEGRQDVDARDKLQIGGDLL
jgi:hypothetical protein